MKLPFSVEQFYAVFSAYNTTVWPVQIVLFGLGATAVGLLMFPRSGSGVAWTYLAGHRYPAFPTFGLPCPTAIFTLGLLAFLKAPYPRSPFVIPVLWSFVGGQAAFLLDVPADYGLVVAGLVGVVLMLQPKAISPCSGKAA